LLSGEGELIIDVICRTLDLPINKLSPLLLQMEFKGLINVIPVICTGSPEYTNILQLVSNYL